MAACDVLVGEVVVRRRRLDQCAGGGKPSIDPINVNPPTIKFKKTERSQLKQTNNNSFC